MASPGAVKVALKVLSSLADEESRKKVIISVIISIRAVILLILLVPIYLITAPLNAVQDIISGDISLSYIWELRDALNTDKEASENSTSTNSSGEIIYNGGTLSMPITVDAKITSLYGYRNLRGKQNLHTGIDFGVPTGTEVLAVKEGTVTKSVYLERSYGHHIIINHGDISTLYAHGTTLFVKEGDTVKQGQVIMTSGSTGNSTGPHLHFEVRVNGKPVNPYPYLFNN